MFQNKVTCQKIVIQQTMFQNKPKSCLLKIKTTVGSQRARVTDFGSGAPGCLLPPTGMMFSRPK